MKKNPDLTPHKLLKARLKKSIFRQSFIGTRTWAGFFRVSHGSWISTF